MGSFDSAVVHVTDFFYRATKRSTKKVFPALQCRSHTCDTPLWLRSNEREFCMSDHYKNREKGFHLWGWILFVVCAAFFIASSINNDDLMSLAGSIIFLVACVVFIIPLILLRNGGGKR